MTTTHLVTRSLRYYWRTHLGVMLGVAASTAVLVGALAVGDSVRYSLRQMAMARLGKVEFALESQERLFRAKLADDMQTQAKAAVAPVLLLHGTAVLNGGEARANHVQVVGVDDRFWGLGGVNQLTPNTATDAVVVNTRLAQQLHLRRGDELLLKVEKPSLLPREAPLSTVADLTVSLHVTVAGVAGDSGFGRFSLQANQVPPYNAFVPLSALQKAAGVWGKVNLLLVGDAAGTTPTLSSLDAALGEHLQLEDVGLELRHLPGQGGLELRSSRIFIEPAVANAALGIAPHSTGVLTYFVNKLQAGNRSAPYPIVTAMDAPPVSTTVSDGEIVVNEWLAQDLQAKPGDAITLSYFIIGPMRRLEERSAQFRVRQVVPIQGAAADPSLMPEFPGLSGVRNCRDWEPGVDVDLARIRDKDEAYWDRYGGTPKAFITLRAGQRLWGNRFGDLTAIRYPAAAGSKEALQAKLRSALNPASLGLYFQPVRAQALASSNQSQDFGQLFLGFSFFLIASAILLTGLLFVFGVEQRSEEVGTLMALGFTPRRVRKLLLQEGCALALLGVALGSFLGIGFTRTVLLGLGTVWRGAVQTSGFHYHVEPLTLVSGCLASVLVAVFAIWFVVRKQGALPPRELLGGARAWAHASSPNDRSGLGRPIAIVAGILGFLSLPLAASSDDEKAAGFFFGAGALLLIAGLGLCHSMLSDIPPTNLTGLDSIRDLAWRNCTRRRGRSLSVVGLLACASFLIVAVGANRHDPTTGIERRASATGGFALMGESTLPIYHDMNDAAQRESIGLEPEVDRNVKFVQLRVHDGDDASCLNLNRAQSPRLLGVNPTELQRRHAFTFSKVAAPRPMANPWQLLNQAGSDDTIPAVGDQATVVWGLGRSVGSILTYKDEHGRDIRVRIVGILAKSILQGSLLISEDSFTKCFPSESGYRMVLVDAPLKKATEVSGTVSAAFEDAGLEVVATARRLAELNSVENTYLSIFQALGGLGLLLGSVGLGVVVLRNVLERRNELALLRAVGFTQRDVRRVVFAEHVTLMLLGLGCGIVAALIAVFPAVRSPGAEVPWASLILTLAAVIVCGLLSIGFATRASLRGPLMEALRNE